MRMDGSGRQPADRAAAKQAARAASNQHLPMIHENQGDDDDLESEEDTYDQQQRLQEAEEEAEDQVFRDACFMSYDGTDAKYHELQVMYKRLQGKLSCLQESMIDKMEAKVASDDAFILKNAQEAHAIVQSARDEYSLAAAAAIGAKRKLAALHEERVTQLRLGQQQQKALLCKDAELAETHSAALAARQRSRWTSSSSSTACRMT
ncbi:hypothetical protein COO60DRAFT_548070 [Scenedesmus sp. NREL 46B-D3]|nr:hypothetical protein COO60DRAFT_548070 [Scenedesmus sp. NREL 46B-D3]